MEGMKFKVSSDELRKHLVGRSEYHRQRGEEKSKELPSLKDALGKIGAAKMIASPGGSNVRNNSYHLDPDDPVEALERDIDDHRHKARTFAFYADHLFDGDYTLSSSDLVAIEMTRQ